jgi:hypothetical protein
MQIATPKVAVLLLVVLCSSVVASAQQVTARLHFKAGEPKKGAFCTEGDKHTILNVITKHVVEFQGDRIKTDAFDVWCNEICAPSTILFCELMAQNCREMKARRRLVSSEIDRPIADETVDSEEVDTSLSVFGDADENNDKRHRHLRRELLSERITEELSEVQEEICNESKRTLTRKISNELGSMVDSLCVRLLRQKLQLDCVVFT